MQFFQTALAGAFVILGQAAHAQWDHMEQGGAFDDTPVQLALTASVSGEYGFGIRCTNPLDAVVLFMTPESISSENAETMSGLAPKILVRVDQHDAFEVPATIDVSTRGTVSARGDLPDELLAQIQEATERVALGLEFIGTVYHETSFSVMGSTAAAQKVVSNCNLDQDVPN